MVALSDLYSIICGKAYESTNKKIEELERLLSPADAEVNNESTPKFTHTSTINIVGLKCQSCVSTITSILSQIPGIDQSTLIVSLIPPRIHLNHNQKIISVQSINRILKNNGYDISKYTTTVITPLKPTEDLLVPLDTKNKTNVYNVVFIIKSSTLSETDLNSALSSLEGVLSCHCDPSGRLYVEYNSNIIIKRSILEFITSKGVVADVEEQITDIESIEIPKKAARAELIRFIIGLILCVPVVTLGMGHMIFSPENPIIHYSEKLFAYNFTVADVILFTCSTACQLILGYPFYVNAFESVFYRRALDMDVLIVLGTSVSYLYFITRLFIRRDDGPIGRRSSFVETSVLIFVFVVLGRYLEAAACVRMSRAISMLAGLSPTFATLVEECADNKVIETRIPSALLEVDDLCKVLRDQSFPCDGVVHAGSTLVDESSITGEPRLTFKGIGDKVICGTINTKSSVIVRIEKIGSQTALSNIIRLIERAQTSQARIQTLANKICKYFIPSVIALSICTFVFWYLYLHSEMGNASTGGYTPFRLSITFAVSVLVVACPCAIGLAMPTAAVMGTSLCAAHGILAKGGSLVYEISSNIRAIAFDKTKTLTTGTIQVSNYLLLVDERPSENVEYILSAFCISDLLYILSALSSESVHPTAASLKEFSESRLKTLRKLNPEFIRTPDISNIRQEQGKGLSVIVKIPKVKTPAIVCIGSLAWINENMNISGSIPSSFVERENEWKDAGESLIYVGAVEYRGESYDSNTLSAGRLLGALTFSDTVHPESQNVISKLNDLGIKTYIITGDNAQSAHHIARKIGIPRENVISDATPEVKARIIQDLKDYYSGISNSATVAMIGDGINDSVALASSDVGIAIGVGSEIAIDCAQVILIKSDLNSLITFLHLSKVIYRRIKFNFIWAFAYNVLIIPIAMGVFYPKWGLVLQPPLAAIMMSLSSVSVIFSSLLLQFYKPSLDSYS